MAKNELIIYDNCLKPKESIWWRIRLKSISFELRDSKGNPVAKANISFDEMKALILARDKSKKDH